MQQNVVVSYCAVCYRVVASYILREYFYILFQGFKF